MICAINTMYPPSRLSCSGKVSTKEAPPAILGLYSNMHLTTTHKLDAGASPVHAVTVFQSDCAEVVRKFTIALKVSFGT
jgi:hypothetical protein